MGTKPIKPTKVVGGKERGVDFLVVCLKEKEKTSIKINYQEIYVNS